MELPENKVELARRGNKVVYDAGDRIVKVFNNSKPESDVFNEALNLARIEESGIRVPAIVEVSRCEEGWALATEKIAGTTLAERMNAAMTYLLFALEDLDLADKYLVLFCKMADMPIQVVRRWTSIVAASELARHRDAKEEEFLRSWIDVADYQ